MDWLLHLARSLSASQCGTRGILELRHGDLDLRQRLIAGRVGNENSALCKAGEDQNFAVIPKPTTKASILSFSSSSSVSRRLAAVTS